MDYTKKHLHKINGLLFYRKHLSQRIFEFVIAKQGKNARKIRFVTFDDEIKKFIDSKELRSRLKVRFYVKSEEWSEGKWSTNCIAEEVLEWKRGEHKIAEAKRQTDLFKQSTYERGTNSIKS